MPRSHHVLGIFILLSSCLVLPIASGAETSTIGRAVFPLRESSDHRTLVDANGNPFILRGRTAWYVISQADEKYVAFLDDSVAKGFNAIEIKGITHDANGYNPPFAGNGSTPFLKRLDGTNWDGRFDGIAADLTTPNEEYWSYMDRFLDACQNRGIAVLFFPGYVGYDGGEQGWMRELVANGEERVHRYGRWVAERYQSRGNLIWMLGGDYSNYKQEELPIERALIVGMKSVKDQASTFYSAEWESNSIGTGHAQFGNEVNFNGVYSWENSIASLSRHAYSHRPVVPAFLLEEPYDEEGPDGNNYNKNATQPVRRFIYWGWLNTIGGYMAGNGYVWRFKPGWERHLNSPGAIDLMHLNSLMTSVESWRLVPSGQDGMHKLIVDGNGQPDEMDYIASAATREGDLMLAYVGPGRSESFQVDVRHLKRPIRARWLDPSSGEYRDAGSIEGKQSQSFTTPGANARGDLDWVLRLETIQ